MALRAAPASIPPCRSEKKEMCHKVVEILQGILNFHKISSKKHVVDTSHSSHDILPRPGPRAIPGASPGSGPGPRS